MASNTLPVAPEHRATMARILANDLRTEQTELEAVAQALLDRLNSDENADSVNLGLASLLVGRLQDLSLAREIDGLAA